MRIAATDDQQLPGARRTGEAVRPWKRMGWPGGLGLLLLLLALPAQGQDLISLYQRARTKAIAEQHLQQTGGWVGVRPPQRLPSLADSARARILRMLADPNESAAPEAPSFVVTAWYHAGKFERGWFRQRFGDVQWAYLGSNFRTKLDTLFTRELRARLQARFGTPTQTLTDFDLEELQQRDDYPQFEYWFILNGRIPLVVMDTNGPFERGLVVATDHRYRDQLLAIRQAFLGPLAEQEERASYIDYYYEQDGRTWYRIKFDGEMFTLEQSAPPRIGRRRLGR